MYTLSIQIIAALRNNMGLKCGIIFLSCIGVVLSTQCSETDRSSNLARCLEEIGEAGFNNSLFWFGTQYVTDCPSSASTIECINPRPQSTRRSIFTRIFPTGYDPSSMDRYLKMVFTSPPGEYTGCGNKFTFNTTWTQEIDPLSPSAVRNWYMKQLPQFEWNAISTEMFTLVVYDVGYLYTHGVYVNIDGNEMTNLSPEQIVKPYHGPQMTTFLKNPYIFLLFKQTGRVMVSANWNQTLNSRAPANFEFNDLMTDWGLTGPVAMNWVVATGDAYAAERMAGSLNMCPNFIAESLRHHSRPFLPDTPELSVGVNVVFNAPALEFTVCCSTHQYIQESFETNPIGNPIYDTYRTSPTPRVTLMKKGDIEQATNFTGDLYTLLNVDPDVPAADKGTQQRPLLHWLISNIQGGNVNTGTEYKAYKGPTPPDRTTHYYYFLLYKQENSLPTTMFSSYAGANCVQSLQGRCLYDVNSLVADANLTLVGASWFTATTDIYVAKRKIDGGEDVHSWCTGMPGYGGDPTCPVGSSTKTLGSLILIVGTMVLFFEI